MATQLDDEKVNNALPANFRLGEYLIESVLGSGGFGITYLAKDTRLNSRVAIKEYFPQAFALRGESNTIAPNTSESTSAVDNYQWGLKEFLKEAQALAQFKHEHIVRVLRFLEANGTAYMVMDYEEGENLSVFLKKSGGFLNESKLLSIFLPILNGLQAVHDVGMLHLDIKPDNIYLRTNGKPMLIDFGSARHAKSRSSRTDRVALTPSYSAIEQYPDVGGKIGPWTDVYGLGATLYKCVTGKRPVDVYKRYQSMKTERIDPLAPATRYDRPVYSNFIRESIVTAMKIKPKNRPQSAYALQLALMGQKMTEVRNVKKPSDGFRQLNVVPTRFAAIKREFGKKRGFFEKLILLLVFGLALIFFTVQGLLLTDVIKESQVFDTVDKIKQSTITFVLSSEKKLKNDFGISFRRNKPEKVASKPLLQKTVKKLPPPFNPAKTLAFTLKGHQSSIVNLAFLVGDTILASSSIDGDIRLWDTTSGKLIHKLRRDAGGLGVMAVSPDGTWLARAATGNAVRIWDAKNDKNGPALNGHKDAINQIVFSPDGKLLATASNDKTIILWNAEDGKRLVTMKGHKHKVLTVAFLPTGSQLASGDSNGEVRYWSVPAGQELAHIRANKPTKAIRTLAYSPNSDIVATGGSQSHLKLWGTRQIFKDKELKGGDQVVNRVVFSPDSKILLVGGVDKEISFWDVNTGERIHRIAGHQRAVTALAVSHDGQWMASGSLANTVRLWKTLKIETTDQTKTAAKEKTPKTAAKAKAPKTKTP